MSSTFICKLCSAHCDSRGALRYHIANACKFAQPKVKLEHDIKVAIIKAEDGKFHCQGQNGMCTVAQGTLRNLQHHVSNSTCKSTWKAILEVGSY